VEKTPPRPGGAAVAAFPARRGPYVPASSSVEISGDAHAPRRAAFDAGPPGPDGRCRPRAGREASMTDTPAPYLAVAFLSALFLLVAGLQAEGLLW